VQPRYCSSPNDLTVIGLSSVPVLITAVSLASPSSGGSRPRVVACRCDQDNNPLSNSTCSSQTDARRPSHRNSVYVPFLLASSGLISKISTPCIFPRISRRSRPVACSRSVGMVPGLAPSGIRSVSEVISAGPKVLAESILSRRLKPYPELTAGRLATFNSTATASGRNERAAYGRKASCAWRARRAWGRRGCRCRLSQCQLCPHMTPQLLQVFSQHPPSLFRHFSCPNGRVPSLHKPRKKDSALTSPHAVGEAAGGHDRARCDGAPGDSRDSATGEHIGGKAESGVWYTGDWVVIASWSSLLRGSQQSGPRLASETAVRRLKTERPNQDASDYMYNNVNDP
jgi:hypothetical protein